MTLDCSGEDSDRESTSDAEDGESCAAGARAGVKAPRKRSKNAQAKKLRQARRNKTITSLVMDQEHTYGFALWQDPLGVDHACGPLAYRDEVVGEKDTNLGVSRASRHDTKLLFSIPFK